MPSGKAVVMNANAHRGRYRKFIGLAVASAVGGLVLAGPALAAPKFGFTVTKVPSVTSIAPGGVVEYAITMTNTGEKTIQKQHFVSVSDPGADAPGPTLVGDPWPLETGDKATWIAKRTVPASTAVCGTTITNTATVTIAPPGQLKKASSRKRANAAWSFPVSATAANVVVAGGICPAPVTPSGTAGTAGTGGTVVGARPAALDLEKTGPAQMLAGGFVVFQVKVTNTGQADATNVILRDLPSRALLWRLVPTGATVSGRNAQWTIGTLAAGQSVTKTVSFRARLGASGQVCNTATASSDQAGAAVDRACVTVTAARRPATPVTG